MPVLRLRKRALSLDEILAWAVAHREVSGHWPTKSSGSILGTKFETWQGVDRALREGLRSLPGGSSLARFLAESKGVRNIHGLLDLSQEQILQWADEHQEQNGEWPTAKSGLIPNSGGEKWLAIDTALRKGTRSLPGGSSLARFLAQHRGVRNRKQLPEYTEELLLQWIDHHFQQTGSWPTRNSGPVLAAPGETWMAVAMALDHGQRGMSGGSSLALFLAEKRAVRNVWTSPNLSIPQILQWIDSWHKSTGDWPHAHSGSIPETDGETWCAIDGALKNGGRNLEGGSSLAKLLAQERSVRNRMSLPNLTLKQILAWVDAHHKRTGQWPTRSSGIIPEASEETWSGIDAALRQGSRRLPGGSSLAKLLAEERGRKNHLDQPPLSYKKILAWADVHFQSKGEWPNVNSGEVIDAPGERWDLIDNALRMGHRTLPGGSSLPQLLVKKRGARDPLHLPGLTEAQICRWAEQHKERTGALPKYNSGRIADTPEETWAGIDFALRHGKRSLPGGSSLAKLLSM